MAKLVNENKYEKYKWFFTSNGSLVVGGKSDDQNELVLKEFLKPNFTVLHTSEPGSPFMIIQSQSPTKKEIIESAIFCGCFSKQWKLGKKEILIDIFLGNQIYKNKLMKVGTFGVKGKVEKLKIKPELGIVIQKGKIRAVPITTKEEIICKVLIGNLNKEEASEKILKIIKDKYHLPITKQEVMSAIPSDKLEIKELK